MSYAPLALYRSPPEQAMGRWVKWVTFGDGSHGSWVGAY